MIYLAFVRIHLNRLGLSSGNTRYFGNLSIIGPLSCVDLCFFCGAELPGKQCQFQVRRVPTPRAALAARRVLPVQAVSLSSSGKRAREIINVRKVRWCLSQWRDLLCLRELTHCCQSRHLHVY